MSVKNEANANNLPKIAKKGNNLNDNWYFYMEARNREKYWTLNMK